MLNCDSMALGRGDGQTMAVGTSRILQTNTNLTSDNDTRLCLFVYLFESQWTIHGPVSLEKLTVAQLVRKLFAFMKPQGSLPYSQEHPTELSPDSYECSLQPRTLFL
jgi:hypothetical protein